MGSGACEVLKETWDTYVAVLERHFSEVQKLAILLCLIIEDERDAVPGPI